MTTQNLSIQESRAAQVIYLVEEDLDHSQDLTAHMWVYGYMVQAFNQLEEAVKAMRMVPPDAILLDVAFGSDDQAGLKAAIEMQTSHPNHFPVLFFASKADVSTRLQAVRAGGQAFFPKPVEASILIDTLDRLLVNPPAEQYRVLIVDDALVQASVNAMHLRKAGMAVETLTEPWNILSRLEDFNPDLLLLDMYMPDCTGMELARLVRQVDSFISLPIVYLSSESDRDKQLEAVGLGGDDFLTKPIKPAHLISAVTARIERYRKLRALMLTDSLTGLYNHTTTKERLEQELARARRLKNNLSLAMLDLDRFKLVNDTHGHPAGDRVLKSLAHLLMRRLRAVDTAGRYGGEEFAVILPNTISWEAESVLNELREGFAKIRHQSGEAEFYVTFSCGIASYPQYDTAAALSDAADRALYAAKTQGRNRIALA